MTKQIEQLMQDGIVSFDQADWQKARQVFEEVLAQDPENQEANAFLGSVLVWQGDITGALNKFNQVKSLNPPGHYQNSEWGVVLNDWGRALLSGERWGEAAEKFAKAVECGDAVNNGVYYTNWGLALERQEAIPNRYEEAAKRYEAAVTADPSYVEAWNGWGRMLVALEKYEEAIEKVNKLMELDPANKGNYFRICGELKEKDENNPNRFEEAAKEYEAAVSVDPSFVDAWNNWGRMFLGLKKYEEAIEKFKKAVEVDPKYEYAYYNWGLALENLNRVEEAAKAYEEAVKANPAYVDAWNDWGRMLLLLKKYEAAIDKFKKAVELEPMYKYAYYNLGWALENQETNPNRFEEAMRYYEAAVKADPAYVDAWNNWGRMLIALEKPEGAIEKFKKVIELDPKYQYAYRNWGWVLESQQSNPNRFEEAARQYEAAVKADPAYVDAWNNWGRMLIELQRYAEAIEKFKKAVELDPKYKYAYYNWGLALENLEENPNRFEAAARQYEAAVNADPGYADAWNDWGRTLLLLQRYDEAIEKFQKAVGLDSKHKYAYRNLGWALENRGDDSNRFEQAARQYEKAVEVDPTYTDAWNDWGRMLLVQQQYEAAIEKFKRALEIDPQYKYAYYNLGWTLEKEEDNPNRYQEAARQYEAAVKVDPTYTDAWNNWGRMLLALSKYDQAIKKFKRAIRIDSLYKYAYYNWGLAAENQEEKPDRYEEAARQYEKAVEADPRYTDAWNNWGWVLLALERNEDAIEKFKQAIEVDPKYKYAYYNWGWTLEKQESNPNRFAEAAKQYEAAVKADPAYADAWNNWGRMLIELGESAEAIEKFKQAIAIDPGYKYAYYNWGWTLEREENIPFEEAARQYEAAVKADEKYVDAWNNWGRMLLGLKQYGQAIEKFKKALELDPQNEQVYRHNWALALENMGNHAEAAQQYESAVTADPKYVDAWSGWGRMLVELKEYEQAINKFQKALEIDPKYKYAYYNWGWALEKQESNPNRYADAAKLYEKAVTTDPGYVDAWTNWGRMLIELEKYDQAIDKFKQAVLVDSKYQLAYYHWGRALEKEGLYTEALEKYKESGGANPEIFYEHIGLLFLSSKQYAEAEEHFKNTAELYSRFPAAYLYLGHLGDRMGKYKEAQKQWKKTIDMLKFVPQEKRTEADWNSLCQLYLYFREYENCSTALEQGLKLFPQSLDLLMTKLDLSLELKQKYLYESPNMVEQIAAAHREARNAFRKAKLILEKRIEKGETADLCLRLGKLCVKMEQFEEAEKKFNRVIELDDRLAEAHNYLGVIKAKDAKYKEAIQNFEKAIEHEPDDFGMISNLGETYLKAKMLNQAEYQYQRVLDIAPSHIDSLIGLAETYMAMGDVARDASNVTDAEDMYAQAIELYSKVIKYAEHQDISMDVSKFLNSRELNGVYYSRGCANIALYDAQLQSQKNEKLLRDAKADFKKVPQNDPNHYKAKRALVKISDRLNPVGNFEQAVAKWAIFVLAALIFLFVQVAFFVGRPTYGDATYKLDEQMVVALKEMQAPAEVVDGVEKLAGTEFSTKEQLAEAIKTNIGEEAYNEFSKALAVDQVEGLQKLKLEPIEGGYYALITFGALIFMIAGLYLQQISRLKFAGIEIEKSSVTQISGSNPLGVERSTVSEGLHPQTLGLDVSTGSTQTPLFRPASGETSTVSQPGASNKSGDSEQDPTSSTSSPRELETKEKSSTETISSSGTKEFVV